MAPSNLLCHESIYTFIDFQASEHWKTHTLSPAIEYIRVRHTDVSHRIRLFATRIDTHTHRRYFFSEIFFGLFVTFSLLLPLLHVAAAVVFGSEFNHSQKKKKKWKYFTEELCVCVCLCCAV